ncbi:unnamed protein product [Arctogadus glacialis]
MGPTVQVLSVSPVRMGPTVQVFSLSPVRMGSHGAGVFIVPWYVWAPTVQVFVSVPGTYGHPTVEGVVSVPWYVWAPTVQVFFIVPWCFHCPLVRMGPTVQVFSLSPGTYGPHGAGVAVGWQQILLCCLAERENAQKSREEEERGR